MGAMRNIRSTTTYFYLVSIRLFFCTSVAAVNFVNVNTTSDPNNAKPGCSSKCGNVTIPYPFGLGSQSCSFNQRYHVICNNSYDPPRPFIEAEADTRWEILLINISESRLRIRNQVVVEACYDSSGKNIEGAEYPYSAFSVLDDSPFTLSVESNRLTAIGCSIKAVVTDRYKYGHDNGCFSDCPTKQKVIGGRCKGGGCCEAAIPGNGRKSQISLWTTGNKSECFSYNPCDYAFLAEVDTFTFRGLSDFSDPSFLNNTLDNVPVAVDWMIVNNTCEEAQNEPGGSYACQANTACSNYPDLFVYGYTCRCLPGYEGNPYLSPGCLDIDECAERNNCSHTCHNQPGTYSCSCRRGYGDGREDGTGCTSSQLFILKLAIGIGLGFLCLLLAAIYIKKRLKHIKLKQDCFCKNGGLLLQEILSSTSHDDTRKLRIFTLKEVKAATKSFSEDQVLGEGGHGIVYKGVLTNSEVVAVKKSKGVDQSQIREFINEMVILGQINHSNVVKVVGCCLESEVPMLVYEYISNGTLFEHIHSKRDGPSWLDWNNCMRIAIETAGALAHLHSAPSSPIIHRDVKSPNILTDENYTAKVSDFGASRLMPLDQTRLSTIVYGTLGYLDPEYFQSGHLTGKSDVFSFGIVLIELLTRQEPISLEREANERSLSTYFLNSIQSGRLLHVLDPQIVDEAPVEQLFAIAKLISRCLSFRGEDRPTMMQVFDELNEIKTHVPHPLESEKQRSDENGHSGT